MSLSVNKLEKNSCLDMSWRTKQNTPSSANAPLGASCRSASGIHVVAMKQILSDQGQKASEK